MLLIPSERRMLRPALPTRCAALMGVKSERPPALSISSTLMPERLSVVLIFGLIALPTSEEMLASAPAGSEPLSGVRSEEHTSELQSLAYLVCRLLLEKKKK